jgi:hypothetical protein
MTPAYRDATATLLLMQMRTKMSGVGGCYGISKLMVAVRDPLLHRPETEGFLGGGGLDSVGGETV